MRLSKRYVGVASSLLVSMVLSFVLTLVNLLRSVGFAPDFFVALLAAWMLNWAISFPLAHVTVSVVRQLLLAWSGSDTPSASQ